MNNRLALGLILLVAAARPGIALAKAHHSGIQGQAVVSPNITIAGTIWGGEPVQAEVGVWTAKGKFVTSFTTGADGSFEIELHPGDYVLLPEQADNPFLYPVHTPVTVQKDEFTPTIIGYYDPPV